MKVAIVGSRDFNDYSQLHYMMRKLCEMFSIDGIISGGAKGADSLAELFAKNYEIPIMVIKPDWNKFGKAAGMIRNGEIIKAADFVVAFWDGRSRGTKNSIDRAFNAKKNCFVFFTLHKKQERRIDISESDMAKHKAIPLEKEDTPCCKTPRANKCDQCQETGSA